MASWRWTERRFSVEVAPEVRVLTLAVTVPEILTTPLTVTSAGGIHTLPRPGDYGLEFAVPAGAREIAFELDRALPPDDRDNRERGLIVREVTAGPK